MHKMLTFTAIVHKEEDLYVSECPEAGTVSQGYSIEETLANLQEATEVYLEEFPDTVSQHPIITASPEKIGDMNKALAMALDIP